MGFSKDYGNLNTPEKERAPGSRLQGTVAPAEDTTGAALINLGQWVSL